MPCIPSHHLEAYAGNGPKIRRLRQMAWISWRRVGLPNRSGWARHAAGSDHGRSRAGKTTPKPRSTVAAPRRFVRKPAAARTGTRPRRHPRSAMTRPLFPRFQVRTDGIESGGENRVVRRLAWAPGNQPLSAKREKRKQVRSRPIGRSSPNRWLQLLKRLGVQAGLTEGYRSAGKKKMLSNILTRFGHEQSI